MTSDGNTHDVYFSVASRMSCSAPIDTIVLSCTINGNLVSYGTRTESAPSYQVYSFPAVFNPGDVVSLDARYAHYHLTSETVVPDYVELELADSSSVPGRHPGKYYNYRDYSCSIIIHDIPGERSWYKAFPARAIAGYKEGESGQVKKTVQADSIAWFYREDPVFANDMMDIPESLRSELSLPHGRGDNWSFTFSDLTFLDGSKTMEWEDFSQRSFIINDNSSPEQVHFDEAWVECTVVFPVGSMNEDVFSYLREVDSYMSQGYISSYSFSEPVVFHDNVEGGIGFVGVIAVSTLNVKLKDFCFVNNIDL